jgi:MFS family permease
VDVQPYRELLARPGVARLLGFAIFARLPRAAISVVVTLYVVLGLDRGYAAAGLIVTAFTVGNAFGAPWRGRAVDRLGLRKALLPSLVAEVAFWGSAPFLGYELLLVSFALYGLLAVPIFGMIRQALAALVPAENQRPAFALDSMSVEITFMLAPAAGVLVATQVSPVVAMVGLGVTSVVSGLCFFALNPPTRTGPAPEPGAPQDHGSGPWWHPTWLSMPLVLVFLSTFGALIVLGGTDVAIVAELREEDALGLTALVFLMWSIPSLIGGLVYGAMHRPVSPGLLLLVMGLLTAPMGLAPNAWWLVLAIVPAGFLCAPVLSATASATSVLSPDRVRGEVMGWYGTAMTAGMALGAPLAGQAADVLGGWGAFAVAGGAGAVLGGIALLAERRWTVTPDEPEPVPELEEKLPESRSVAVAGTDALE